MLIEIKQNVIDTVSPGQIVWCLSMINGYLLCSGCPLLTKPDIAISPLFLPFFYQETEETTEESNDSDCKKSFPLRNFHQPTAGRTDFLQAAFQGLFPICRVPSRLQASLLVQGWRISDWHLPEWFCGYKPNLPVILKWHRKTTTKTRSCKVPSTTWNVAGILGIYVGENFTSLVPAIKCLHVHLLQYFTWENEWNQR